MEEGKQRKVWLWHEHVWRKWKFHGRNGFSWTFPSWRRSQKQCLIETTPSQSQSVIRSILSFQPLIPTVTHSFQSLYSIIYFNFKCSLCFINICDEVYSGKHLKLPKFMYWSRQARETKWTAWQLIYSSLYFHAPLLSRYSVICAFDHNNTRALQHFVMLLTFFSTLAWSFVPKVCSFSNSLTPVVFFFLLNKLRGASSFLSPSVLSPKQK